MGISTVGLTNDKIKSNQTYKNIKTELEELSKKENIDIFLMSEMLIDSEKKDEYVNKLIVAIKGYKILVIDFSENDEREDYYEDFLDDLEYYSKKYEYDSILKRKRQWKNLLEHIDLNNNLKIESKLKKLESELEKRKLEVIYSLITGNINDPKKIGSGVPETIIEKVQKNIISFDTNQAEILFNQDDGKLIKIQGLAGTGKTELLLRKLKDSYVDGNKVALVCHNEVLADSLRKRIPKFFNFMKVDVQIDSEKLKCFRAWGSRSDKNSGLYSYICRTFDLKFYSYNAISSFEKACKLVLEEIENLENFIPPFDYIFIDEAQDFDINFVKFCLKLANKKVYIAGDVFQNIFEIHKEIELSADSNYLLKKCYRTDPKMLSYAHAISLGLYEDKPLGWLTKEEWEQCGYNYYIENDSIKLSREPVNRFGGLEMPSPFKIKIYNDYINKIIEVIKNLKKENKDISPNDIGIMFQGFPRYIRGAMDELRAKLYDEFGFYSNLAFDTREKRENQIFISTQNHTKGLEFPFIICILIDPLDNLNKNDRNALYMMLTRSFITSYLLVSQSEKDKEILQKPLIDLREKKVISFKNKSEEEINEIKKSGLDLKNITESRQVIIDKIIGKIVVENGYEPEIEEKVREIVERNKESLKNFEKVKLEEKIKKIVGALI